MESVLNFVSKSYVPANYIEFDTNVVNWKKRNSHR